MSRAGGSRLGSIAQNIPSGAVGIECLEVRALIADCAAANPAAGATNPAVIQSLAAAAYVWGLAPEFVQRFSTYNTTISAPLNALEYGSTPAAWNNAATNAGDSSVLYLNGFTDFSKTPALVLTVPASSNQYYVVNYLDDYINTIGSVGTRTTPSNGPTSYLLVGPNSPYANLRTVKIDGYQYRVLASDTNLNWMLIRVATNTLVDASNPQSVPSVYANVVQKFALNTLAQFKQNGNQPVYPASFASNTIAPTAAEVLKAKPYQNTPTEAVQFFNQLGTSVKGSPSPPGIRDCPARRSSDSPLGCPSVRRQNPLPRSVVRSAGRLRSFRRWVSRRMAIGSRKTGEPLQLQALQAGYVQGQQALDSLISGQSASSSTNYWTILNTIIGTYPNNPTGYKIRSAIVLNGGSANVPLDAVYPNLSGYMGTAKLDGNNTYSITFTPPSSGQTLPANGIDPPLVNNSSGNPAGFWSITLYQPDPSEVAAPFLSQASVLNTSYSTANLSVLSVNPTTNVMTVSAPTWGTLTESTPILFGANASQYNLKPNTVYYVASTPTAAVDPTTQATTYSFSISQEWVQDLSSDNVPIQYSGDSRAHRRSRTPGGSGPAHLWYGPARFAARVRPALHRPTGPEHEWVAHLVVRSLMPQGVAPSNWIPTPSTAYFNSIYPGQTVSTTLQILLRMYYPTPGNPPPSILPYSSGSTQLPESYIPPAWSWSARIVFQRRELFFRDDGFGGVNSHGPTRVPDPIVRHSSPIPRRVIRGRPDQTAARFRVRNRCPIAATPMASMQMEDGSGTDACPMVKDRFPVRIQRRVVEAGLVGGIFVPPGVGSNEIAPLPGAIAFIRNE